MLGLGEEAEVGELRREQLVWVHGGRRTASWPLPRVNIRLLGGHRCLVPDDVADSRDRRKSTVGWVTSSRLNNYR